VHPVIQKTFGGLSRPYYIRQFLFGLIIPAIAVYAFQRSPTGASIWTYIFLILNTFIYPYSRFVYESIVGYILGNNVFYLNALVMLFFKFMTMALCWVFAIFVAPIGLLYLYFYHSKQDV
jgi:hypothetical protein